MLRRNFMNYAAWTITLPWLYSFANSFSSSHRKLRILILGGTNFLGPAIVDILIQKGHEVVLFNRGITNPQLFPELKKFRGDRSSGESGYSSLAASKLKWDVVIDVWPENPNYVEEAILALNGAISHYFFISSVAVYNNYVEIGIDESAILRKASEFEAGNYNANKVLCEKVVQKYFPEKHTILRPGAIVGQRDPGPFGTYVLNRLYNHKEILAPDSDDPVQFIDAADIGRYIELCAVNSITGIFNTVGPLKRLGYKEWLMQCKQELNSQVDIIWMDPGFILNEMKLEPFTEIPFWIPIASDPEPGFYQISAQKAFDTGLEISDLGQTVSRSFNSFREGMYIAEPESEAFFGIKATREMEIIAEWKKRD